jgi:hypothetical protein
MRHRRVYAALKRLGLSAAKALECVIDAKRGDPRALQWARVASQLHRKRVRLARELARTLSEWSALIASAPAICQCDATRGGPCGPSSRATADQGATPMKPKWIVRARIGHEVFEQECFTDSGAKHFFWSFFQRFPDGTITQICIANGRVVRKHG